VIIIVLLLVIAVLVLGAMVVARSRHRPLARLYRPLGWPTVHEWRERTASIFALQARPSAPSDSHWATPPAQQPSQLLYLPEINTAVGTRPPFGLAVAVRATGPTDAEQPDAYYAQRNVVALARGVSAAGAGQRAAALTLSAVMTSPLGRSDKAEEALRTGVESANKLVRSVARREPRYSDMATTLDVVYLELQDGWTRLYFAHVGNSSVWLKRASSSSVELLTQSDAPDGPLLRAVGLNPDLTPSIGEEPVNEGDRVFLTTASRSCFVTQAMMDGAARNGGSLPECAAALAAVARSPVAEGITIVAVEVSRFASFVA
jgi:hypothetical protein